MACHAASHPIRAKKARGRPPFAPDDRGVSSGAVHPGTAPSPNGGNGGGHPGRHRHQTVGTVDITVTKRSERWRSPRTAPSPNGGNGGRSLRANSATTQGGDDGVLGLLPVTDRPQFLAGEGPQPVQLDLGKIFDR